MFAKNGHRTKGKVCVDIGTCSFHVGYANKCVDLRTDSHHRLAFRVSQWTFHSLVVETLLMLQTGTVFRSGDKYGFPAELEKWDFDIFSLGPHFSICLSSRSRVCFHFYSLPNREMACVIHFVPIQAFAFDGAPAFYSRLLARCQHNPIRSRYACPIRPFNRFLEIKLRLMLIKEYFRARLGVSNHEQTSSVMIFSQMLFGISFPKVNSFNSI